MGIFLVVKNCVWPCDPLFMLGFLVGQLVYGVGCS
jgi:hypothetical protein